MGDIKMKQKRNIFLSFCAAIMCVIIIFGMAGCKKETGPVELRFMGYNPESSRVTYLKYLEENLTDIKIIFEFVSLENYNSVLISQLKDGVGPDIIEVGGETKLLAGSGYLLDITEQDFVKKYARSGLSAYVMNDKIYATPLQSWYEGIFYNKKIFADNGISVPKSLDQFIAVHKILSEKGIKPQTMGAQSWEPMMKQSIGVVNNEFYSDPANKNFDIDFNAGKAYLAESWLEAVLAWSKVIEQGCLTPDMLDISYEQALAEFASGKAAMWESGPWAVNDIININPDIEKDLGMFPIPGLSEGVGWLVGGPGSALAVNAKSKHIGQALQLLDLTATPEAQQALIKDNAGSSFLVGVSADLGDIYSDCGEAFQAGNVYAPWVSVWEFGNLIVEEYGKSLREVLAGAKTIERALKDADEVCGTMRK